MNIFFFEKFSSTKRSWEKNISSSSNNSSQQ